MTRSISDKIGVDPKVAGLRVIDQMYPESNPGIVVQVMVVFDGNRQVAEYVLRPLVYVAE
jgi:hypothetical protein